MGLGVTVRRLAAETPASRNRVVDLWRAVSILAVVLGHWTMSAVWVDGGRLQARNVLELASWAHPVTWAFQVMPLFFVVGGYANGLSWRGARRRGTPYAGWLRSRGRRLVLPTLPLLVVWPLVAVLALRAGADASVVSLAATIALMPTWFLAAYLAVVVLAPATLVLWERFGWWSLAGGAVLVAGVDVASLALDSVTIGFVNYLLVFGTAHQVGYAWLDGELDRLRRRVLLAAGGLAGAVALVALGPYPVSMVGLAGQDVTNTYPPRLPLLLLGALQAGLMLLLQPAATRLTAGRRAWTVVVAVNARVMTVYLWHLTAMVTVLALASAVGGVGLSARPLSASWWALRPVWYAVLAVATTAYVAVLGALENPVADLRPAPPVWRAVAGVLIVVGGLASMAVVGLVRGGRVDLLLPALPLLGALVGGLVGPPSRGAPAAGLPGAATRR